MQTIQVRTLTGKELTFEIGGSDTLSDLRGKLQDEEEIPLELYRLVFLGVQLRDDGGLLLDQINTIQARRLKLPDSDENMPNRAINSDIIIHQLIRLRGGANIIAPQCIWSDSVSDEKLLQSGNYKTQFIHLLYEFEEQILLNTYV